MVVLLLLTRQSEGTHVVVVGSRVARGPIVHRDVVYRRRVLRKVLVFWVVVLGLQRILRGKSHWRLDKIVERFQITSFRARSSKKIAFL